MGSSTRLGPQFAPLLPLYLPTLLRLLCRTNKLYISRSATTIISIIKNTKLVDVLRFIVGEWQSESGKSATFREKAAEVAAYLLSPGPGGELPIEKEVLDRRVEELEWIIKTAAVDRDAKVRAEAKKCWEVYKREWPERVARFVSIAIFSFIRLWLTFTYELQLHFTDDSYYSKIPQRQRRWSRCNFLLNNDLSFSSSRQETSCPFRSVILRQPYHFSCSLGSSSFSSIDSPFEPFSRCSFSTTSYFDKSARPFGSRLNESPIELDE